MGIERLKLLVLLSEGNCLFGLSLCVRASCGLGCVISREGQGVDCAASPKPCDLFLSILSCLACCSSADRRLAAIRSLKLCFGLSGSAGSVVRAVLLLANVEPFLALFSETSEAFRPLSIPRRTRAGDVGSGTAGGGMWLLMGDTLTWTEGSMADECVFCLFRGESEFSELCRESSLCVLCDDFCFWSFFNLSFA